MITILLKDRPEDPGVPSEVSEGDYSCSDVVFRNGKLYTRVLDGQACGSCCHMNNGAVRDLSSITGFCSEDTRITRYDNPCRNGRWEPRKMIQYQLSKHYTYDEFELASLFDDSVGIADSPQASAVVETSSGPLKHRSRGGNARRVKASNRSFIRLAVVGSAMILATVVGFFMWVGLQP